MPKLSVILSVLNGEKFIEETIHAVLKQTFQDFEFIIIDDGSTDNTSNLVKSFTDERIKLVQLDENIGIPKARNTGLEISTGEYIAVVDVDDPPLPTRFEKQTAYLDSHSEIAVVGCQFKVFNEEGLVVSDSKAQNDSPLGEVENLNNILRGSISTMHPCAMYRGDLLRQYRYDERFKVGHDYDLGLRLYENGWQTDNLDEYLNMHRDHAQSVTDQFQSTDFNDHHIAFSEFYSRMTNIDYADNDLKAYAWSFHFRFLPPDVTPISQEQTIEILRSLLDAYSNRYPKIATNEIRNAILNQAIPREAMLLEVYWEQLLINQTSQGPIALYGAGAHSSWVIRRMRNKGLEISCIYDDTPKSDSLEGVTVKPTSHLNNDPINIVIISSDVHHQKMTLNLNKQLTTEKTIINPYENLPNGPFQKC